MKPSPELRKFERALKRLTADELKALVERRHPEYACRLEHWNFLEATFNGGREWFEGNIFKYVKEGVEEYRERVERAYRFPHTREVVNLTNKYIFKGDITRNETDATEDVKAFWKTSTLRRNSISDFMNLVSEKGSVFGRIWIAIDNNAPEGDATILETKVNGYRVYGYTIRPQDLLDLGVSSDGDLQWVLARESHRDDTSILSSGGVETRYRLWDKDFWALFGETRSDSGEVTYRLLSTGEHGLGRVPVFPHDHVPSENLYHAPGQIEDIAYLDRAVANYLSNLDAIIQDQTFSQLIIPHQAMLPGDDEASMLLEMGTKRILTFDASATVEPKYISPDVKQAGVILAVIAKIIDEIYHSIGMAGERTKQDNAQGIDNSSGVAKAYDFERLNALLASKARSLQSAENTICELVDSWHGEDVEIGSYNLVLYPANFDVRGLSDELKLGTQLSLLQAPDEVRRQQMLVIIDKVFPHLGEALIAKMKAEINSWPPAPEVVSPVAPGSPPSAFKENKQGQNNDKPNDKPGEKSKTKP